MDLSSLEVVQAKIDEPWHWVFDPAAAKTSEADRVAISCQK